MPTLAELEAAGAVIGEIIVVPQDIFDLTDPRENKTLYRLANRLHITTQPEVIRRNLLFKSGDKVSVQRIEETERLLRSSRYLYAAEIRPVAYRDGVVDLEVRTRDTWSLEPGFSIRRAGGVNTTKASLEDDNLLGTGVALGVSYQSDVDRKGTQFQLADRNILGSRIDASVSVSRYSDGDAQSFSVARPFYSLDTRQAAGLLGARAERINPVYNAGEKVAEYRYRHRLAEAFAGVSTGLVRGWTRRASIGLHYQDEEYAEEPGRPRPADLPANLTVAGPFVQLELIQDAYRKESNVRRIGRTEDISLGFNSTLRLGRGLESLGSTRDLWFYQLSASNGFDIRRDTILLTGVSASGRHADQAENQQLGASATYFQRRDARFAYYASLSYDVIHNPDTPDALQIGGDTGLRGYPLRYQSGEKRALMSLEARYYTDWFPFRLIRVAGAVFYDIGRAWGGENTNTTNPGWLSDAGFGLRFVNDRSAFGQVLHADIAFPLNREGDIKSLQFIVRTKIAL